jgi:hypothetical protein
MITMDLVNKLHKDNDNRLPFFRGERIVHGMMKRVYTNWSSVVRRYKGRFHEAAKRWFREDEIDGIGWLPEKLGHPTLAGIASEMLEELTDQSFLNTTMAVEKGGVHQKLVADLLAHTDDKSGDISTLTFDFNEVTFTPVSGEKTVAALMKTYEAEMGKDETHGRGSVKRAFQKTALKQLKQKCSDDMKDLSSKPRCDWV